MRKNIKAVYVLGVAHSGNNNKKKQLEIKATIIFISNKKIQMVLIEVSSCFH